MGQAPEDGEGQGERRIKRRTVLGGLAVAGAGAVGALPSAFPEAAPRRTGTIDDVRHVVVLMQENRSFDHYYGTMAGVRGFGDRAALRLPSGGDVFHQPDPRRADGGHLLPFHLDTSHVDGQDIGDLPHDWHSTHVAWNGGAYDSWVPAKSGMTMGYFTAADIPFQRALASSFTLCDNYFCSLQGPTTPNRLYHWTGTVDPAGVAGGPATKNPKEDYDPVYHWTTYPERLEAAGISWQIYSNNEERGVPEGYVGDYGDNPLWLFPAFHESLESSDPLKSQLALRANMVKKRPADSGKGHNVDHVLTQFLEDCEAGALPAVSWVVAPYGYCEHPAARPVDGAVYVERVLKALWDNPSLWESTVVLINYDENDGFFDHVVPPTAPPGTPGEMLPALQPGRNGLPRASGPLVPIGLGPRVPLTVISPWSRGGWVNSQVFDHTSVLRFLEVWTGVKETNISAWRRKICGDLTSCFDFRTHDTTIPLLPDTTTLRAKAEKIQSKLPKPAVPAPGKQAMPTQDSGTAKARALPYQPVAWLSAGAASLSLHLANHGAVALQLSAYAYHQAGASQRFDVDRAGTASGEIGFTDGYDVAVHGPNGFLVEAAGNAQTIGVDASIELTGTPSAPTLTVKVTNNRARQADVTVTDQPGLTVPANGSRTFVLDPMASAHGWYDVTLTLSGESGWRRRFAGHLENGRPSRTGP